MYESIKVEYNDLCECIIFKVLNKYRLKKNKEFFQGDIAKFIDIIDKIMYAIDNKILKFNDKNKTINQIIKICAIDCNGNNTDNDNNYNKKKKEYICDKCNKQFNKKSYYDTHINKKYSCDKNNTCGYCEKKFCRSNYLTKHLTICKKKIIDETDNELVNKAKKYVKGILIYECHKCSKIFNKKSHYVTHINKKIPCNIDSKVCEYCEKKFCRNNYLTKHLLICKMKNNKI
jgi:uncharacterized Zn-finger protein